VDECLREKILSYLGLLIELHQVAESKTKDVLARFAPLRRFRFQSCLTDRVEAYRRFFKVLLRIVGQPESREILICCAEIRCVGEDMDRDIARRAGTEAAMPRRG
jgi:hypothetical protein